MTTVGDASAASLARETEEPRLWVSFLTVSPFVHYGIIAVIVLWVVGYERSMFSRTGEHRFAVA